MILINLYYSFKIIYYDVYINKNIIFIASFRDSKSIKIKSIKQAIQQQKLIECIKVQNR